MMNNNFENPIMPGADPFVLLHEGKYYMYCTIEKDTHETITSNDGFFVYESSDLKTWTNKGLCLDKKDVMGDKWFWAPEITYYKGKFYMVYSAEEHMGVAVSDSPLGPFKQENKRWLSEKPGIDGHIFIDDDGKVYFYCVRFDNGNKIVVTTMSEDLMSIDEENEKLIIEATEPWETIDCLVTEGPFVLKHNDIYYLTYSANHTRCQDYAVGYATATNPLGPFTKYKNNPILKKNNELVGVGHHSFTTSKDKKTLICSYHCHYNNIEFTPRMFCLNTAEFVQKENETVLVVNSPKKN